MKKASILFIALLVVLLTGCTQTKPDTTTNQLIVENEATIRLLSGVATVTSLTAIPDVDRAKVGATVYSVAEAVHATVDRDVLDTESIRVLILAKIKQIDPRYRPSAEYLLTVIDDIVRQKAISLKDLPADSQQAALKAFLRGASEGVMQASAPYKASV